MKNTKFSISEMWCTQCGNKGLSIARTANRNREPGHLKKLYCVHCQKETNHAEVRAINGKYTFTDFILEKEYNNFDKTGNRKEPFNIFKNKLIKEGVIIND